MSQTATEVNGLILGVILSATKLNLLSTYLKFNFAGFPG